MEGTRVQSVPTTRCKVRLLADLTRDTDGDDGEPAVHG